jgi:enamine deaminase RidA (YjgF/YER057c/UK114 family)
VFGEKGRHTRVAIGAATLPGNAAVEVDAVFAIG